MVELKLKEGRRYPRRIVKWPAIIKCNNRLIRVTTVNISESGALVESTIKLKSGQPILLMVKGLHNGNKIDIYVKANIKHTVVKLNNFQLGIQFNEVSEEAKNFLVNFIYDL